MGDQAWLNSLIFDATANRCFKFFYHHNGYNIGSLRIDILYENGQREVLWIFSQDKGDKWYEGSLGVNSKNMTYR